MKLGFSTGFFWQTNLSEEEKIAQILAVQSDAIELGVGRVIYLDRKISEKAFELLRLFKYRSIHMPNDVRYPGSNSNKIISQIMNYARLIDAHTVVVHPDQIDDYKYLAVSFGNQLAIENTNSTSQFGRSVSDMKTVFERLPNARLILDVNHVLTNDRTLKLASDFDRTFAKRLAHYHLSGLGQGGHPCLSQTHEDIIFEGIIQDVPVILESTPGETWIEPRVEYDYVRNLDILSRKAKQIEMAS